MIEVFWRFILLEIISSNCISVTIYIKANVNIQNLEVVNSTYDGY